MYFISWMMRLRRRRSSPDGFLESRVRGLGSVAAMRAASRRVSWSGFLSKLSRATAFTP